MLLRRLSVGHTVESHLAGLTPNPPIGLSCFRKLLYRSRDSTRYINGRHVRDLSMLNRDLNKVLLVTTDPHAAALQPENAVLVRHLCCLVFTSIRAAPD